MDFTYIFVSYAINMIFGNEILGKLEWFITFF